MSGFQSRQVLTSNYARHECDIQELAQDAFVLHTRYMTDASADQALFQHHQVFRELGEIDRELAGTRMAEEEARLRSR